MRVLSQGQMDLFDLAFARLLGLELARFRNVFYEGGARAGGAGLPRRRHRPLGLRHRLQPVAPGARHGGGLTGADMAEVDKVFASFTRQRALDELRIRCSPDLAAWACRLSGPAAMRRRR